MIELNNPAPLAGTSLFLWPQEKSLLKKGPFEIRVRSEPKPFPREDIYPAIKTLLDETFPNYAKLEQLLLEPLKKEEEEEPNQSGGCSIA